MTKELDPVMKAFLPFAEFSKVVLDGCLVVDATGRIFKSNQETAAITGLTSKQLLKLQSMDESIKIYIGEAHLPVLELLQKTSLYRADQVKAVSSGGDELVVTLSYFPFVVDGVVIGAFILLRNMTGEADRDKNYSDKNKSSITDSLTGLYNRRYFEDTMAAEEVRIALLPVGSDHRNLSIIMGDIDHFKKVNDKYGHPAGDYVILTVAKIFQECFRKTDIVCRYGGEEFLVILPASDAEGSAVAANKARAAIEAYRFVFEGVTIPINISMGVAQMMVGFETGKGTIARADAALYESKHNGRNQVSVHTGNQIIGTNKTAA